MLFSSIPGLTDIKTKLTAAVENNHLAHALLLYGMEGTAKLQMAVAVATYVNCKNRSKDDSCGECDSCGKMAKLIHPDLNFTFPIPSKSSKEEANEDDNKAPDVLRSWRQFALTTPYGNVQDWILHNAFTKQLNISKGAAKSILQTLSLKSFEGGYKIILIWCPELMHNTAANSLLKILEEPPEKTLFLLVSSQPDLLLNTILSRTQKILIRGFTDTEISGHLVSTGLTTPEAAMQIAPLADGSMREAYRLIDQVQDENTNKFRDWMRICYNLNINSIVSQADAFYDEDKEAQKTLFITGLHTLRESLLKKGQLDQLMRSAPSDREFIENFGTKVLTEEKIMSLYQLLNDAHYHLERNANAKILFADLSFNAARILRK